MKRNIILVFLVIIGFLLQTTVFSNLNFGGITPNILIILTATYGFMFGRRYGMSVGFACGLLMDIFYGSVLGFYSLIFLYIGFGNGYFHRIFYQEDIKLPLILITVSDLLYSIITFVLLFVLRGRFDVIGYFSKIIIPELIYTLFVTVFIYPCILFLNRTKDPSPKRGEIELAKED